MAKRGYLRVSTEKQSYERQLFVLQAHNIDRIYEEKISGTKKALGREKFDELMQDIQEGDEVYFESMSRMARSMQDLIDTTNIIVKDKKAKVIFIKENLAVGAGKDGLDAMGALIFNVMGAFAQFERDLISDRTKQTLAAKKANGIKLGRPETICESTKEQILAMRGKPYRFIAEELGVSIATVSRTINAERNNNE